MPGFDRTGPEGMGPMTGGRRGLCGSGTNRRFASWPGRGRGRGYRNIYRNTGMPGWTEYGNTNPSIMDRDEELDFLKEQETLLKNELKSVEKRLRDFGSQHKNEI
jgi:hypothetical protein